MKLPFFLFHGTAVLVLVRAHWLVGTTVRRTALPSLGDGVPSCQGSSSTVTSAITARGGAPTVGVSGTALGLKEQIQ